MAFIKKIGKKFVSLSLCFVLLMSLITPAMAQRVVSVEAPSEDTSFTRNNWIWSSAEETTHDTSYFRNEYQLKAAPVKLQINTSAHNHLKYYVNGNLITGYVSPAPASLPNNVYYLSYEFEEAELEALLNEEKNQLCLAAIVQFMGDKKSTNYVVGHPAFWTEVTVTYEDDSTEILTTDESWRALGTGETPYATTRCMFEKRGIGTQVDYDARKMPDGLAWTQYGYNEADYAYGNWDSAVLANEETSSWKMRLQNIPEGAVHQEITPTAIGKQEIGYQVFDAGQLVTGWVKIRASAPEGTRIYIRYSEYRNGDVVHHGVGSTGQTSEEYRDFYTFSGNGVETFVADFDYRAFRYFEIVGLPDWIQVEDITVEWASTDIHQISTFTSSDHFLNQLYEACINTQINNTIGMTVDCPHREQAQYLADSQLQYALFSYAFEEAPEVMYKTLFDFATQQLENGRFVYTSPTTSYTSIASIPEWDLRYTAILSRYYELTGDLAGVAEFYDDACKNVNFHYAMVDTLGLLIDDPAGTNISDHPGKGVKDDPNAHPTVANLLLYDSLNRLATLAELLEKSDEATAWSKKASALRDNINSYLKDSNSALYKHHSETDATNVGITAMAINVGVSESCDLQKQLDAISLWTTTEDANAQTSIVLTYELFCAIMNHGTASQKEYLYQRMSGSWRPMVEKGHKTTWERFEDMSSHSHAWSAYPAYIMLRGFAGIRFDGISYSDITVKPFLPADVSHISATVDIPDSDQSITVSLERNNGYQLVVKPPKGETVTVAVPRVAGSATNITANGKTVFTGGVGKNSSGLQYLFNDAEYVYFAITGRTYTFRSTADMASSEEEVTVTILATEGGTVFVEGSEVSLPYSESFNVGTELHLNAVPNEGYAFTGWFGSLGSTEAEISLALNSNLTLNAGFEERSTVQSRTITVTGPEGAGWAVSYLGTSFPLPATWNVKSGTEVTLTLEASDLSSHQFVSWAGDADSTEERITFTVNSDVQLQAIGSYKIGSKPTNLALGKTVTSDNGVASSSWAASKLTDGSTTDNYGISTKVLKENELPHRIVVDLGSTTDFNKIVIYPRIDKVYGDTGEVICFPAKYKLQISNTNSSDWVDIYDSEKANASMPKVTDDPITITLEEGKTARYLAFVTLEPGNPDPSKNLHTQLRELEIYNTAPPESVTLALEGSGKVMLNEEILNLPYSGTLPGGTVVTLKPVLPEGFVFTGWTGDLISSENPLYITLNGNISITANYADPSTLNLAKGKEVLTSHNTAGTSWAAKFLTDGINTDGGSTAHGISTVALSEGEKPYFTINFGSVTEFNKIIIYPRALYDGNTVRCFPAKWSLLASNDNAADTTKWTKLYADEDAAIHGKEDIPITVNLTSPVSAQYLRFACDELGLGDDHNNLHLQLYEIEVYNIPSTSAEALSTSVLGDEDQSTNLGGETQTAARGYNNQIATNLQTETRLNTVSADFAENVSTAVKPVQKPADRVSPYAYLWALIPVAVLAVGVTFKKKVFSK